MSRRRTLCFEPLEDRRLLTSEWEEIFPATAPTPRQDHKMAAISGVPYVFGGRAFDEQNDNILMGDLWRYDAANETFVEITPNGDSPPARYGHAMAELNGKLYVFGGNVGGLTNDLREYDPAANAWTNLPQSGDVPDTRFFHTMVALNDRLYVFGGLNSNSTLNSLLSYDPGTMQWTRHADSPISLHSHSASVADGKMFVFGGKQSTLTRDRLLEYDPAIDSWSIVLPASSTQPTPRAAHTAVGVSAPLGTKDRKVWVFGGESQNSNVALKDTWEYRLDTNAWEQKEDRRTELKNAAGALLFDINAGSPEGESGTQRAQLLLFGGQIGGVPTNRVFQYDPSVAYQRTPAGNGADSFSVKANAANAAVEVIDDATSEVVETAPLATATGLVVEGAADEDDTFTIDLTDLPALAKGVEVRGGAGAGDTLILTGSGDPFDLRSNDRVTLERIEVTGGNTLLIDAATADASAGDGLQIMAEPGNTVDFGDGWSLTGTQIDGGEFFRIVEQAGSKLLLDGPANHQNPVDARDVNASNSFEPLDALIIINELNDPQFSGDRNIALNPVNLASDNDPANDFDDLFRDTNGDGFLTAIDALIVINFLNDEANSEGEAVPLGFVAAERIVEHSPSSTEKGPVIENAVTRRIADDAAWYTGAASRAVASRDEFAAAIDKIAANDQLVELGLQVFE